MTDARLRSLIGTDHAVAVLVEQSKRRIGLLGDLGQCQAAIGVGVEVGEAHGLEQAIAAGKRGEFRSRQVAVAIGVGLAKEAADLALPLIAGDIAVLVEVPGDGGGHELALNRRSCDERRGVVT